MAHPTKSVPAAPVNALPEKALTREVAAAIGAMLHAPQVATPAVPKAETPMAPAPAQQIAKPAPSPVPVPSSEPAPREITATPTPPDRGQTLDLPLSRPPVTEAQPTDTASKPAPARAGEDEAESH